MAEFDADVLARARKTLIDVMDGKAGRGALFRMNAAKLILDKNFLANLSDEDLLAEVRRRADAAKSRASSSGTGERPTEAKAKD